MTPIKVSLSYAESFVAAQVGVRRRLTAVYQGQTDRNGAGALGVHGKWFADVIGALSECAVAKAAGLYWPGSVNANKKEPDIPPDIQVRHAQDGGCLIVRNDDIQTHKYVLVTGDGPEFCIHGWITWPEATNMADTYMDKGGRNEPCFWIPASRLLSFESVTDNQRRD